MGTEHSSSPYLPFLQSLPNICRVRTSLSPLQQPSTTPHPSTPSSWRGFWRKEGPTPPVQLTVSSIRGTPPLHPTKLPTGGMEGQGGQSPLPAVDSLAAAAFTRQQQHWAAAAVRTIQQQHTAAASCKKGPICLHSHHPRSQTLLGVCGGRSVGKGPLGAQTRWGPYRPPQPTHSSSHS